MTRYLQRGIPFQGWRRLLAWLGAILLCQALAAVAQAADVLLVGAPPVERFTPDIDVFPQNFAVVQDARGIVYVGNYQGLLEFDGERWQLTPLPNGDLVRSMAIGPDGTVYVGGFDLFGYIKRDASGRAAFVDLSAKYRDAVASREVGDIWQVMVAPEGVYFRALRELFFWEPKTGATAHWQYPGRFGALATLNGKTLLQFRGEGFRVREGNEWRLRPDTRNLTTQIPSVVPLADGALLGLANDGKWWRIDDTSVTPAGMPAGMPPSTFYTRGLLLKDKSLALVSVEGELVILDPSLTDKRDVKLDSGFLSGLSAANDGGLLVSAQQSIYRVAWPSAWSVLGTEHGADGDLEKLAEWNGQLYLMASGGVSQLQQSPTGMRFARMPWGNTSAFDLIGLDRNRALLATSQQLMVIDHDKVRAYSRELIYPRSFRRSHYHPGRIFLGTDNGLRVIDTQGNGIRVSAGTPREVTISITSVVESSANEVWVSTERHGVWRYSLSSAGDIIAAEEFGAAKGLRFSKVTDATVAVHPDGSLIAGTHKGIYRFDGARFVETEMDGLGTMRAPEEMLNFLFTPDGDHWAYGPTRIYHRPKGKAWRQQEVRTLRRGAIGQSFVGASGQVVFIGMNALLIRHPSVVTEGSQPPQVMLRRVTQLLSNSKNIDLPLDGEAPVHLKLGDFGLRFEFALPELVQPGIKRYRGHLAGVEEGPVDWGQSSTFTYSDLRAREYRLEVRAMDSQGRISDLKPFEIVVDPPWYATTWARAVAALISIAAVWMSMQVFARYRTRRLELEKNQLENMVDARTRELKEANRRLDMMAHVDGLTGVPNRRRFDEYLQAVWDNCAGQNKPLSLLAIDVDNFKEYNDQHGHLAGDEVLKNLVRVCMTCLRRTEDLLARYGGEEFVVVLPSADDSIAQPLAEAMRQKVEESGLGVTISIGIRSLLPRDGAPSAELVADADAALYKAKRGGRNRVCVHGATD